MKKLAAALLAGVMVLSMAACGSTKTTETTKAAETTKAGETKAEETGKAEETSAAEAREDDGKLIMATEAGFAPYEYTEDGSTVIGVDVDIANEIAKAMGKELVIQNMQFDAVCLSVGQQKCDIAMAGLTVNEERQEYVTFSNSYYQASQRLIVPSTDKSFDDCKDADAVVEKLNKLTDKDKIGVQAGTTAQYFIEGDEDWGFDGLPATCVPYKNGSLAVQDMLNGNLKYVIIDAAPAAAISSAINEVQ